MPLNVAVAPRQMQGAGCKNNAYVGGATAGPYGLYPGAAGLAPGPHAYAGQYGLLSGGQVPLGNPAAGAAAYSGLSTLPYSNHHPHPTALNDLEVPQINGARTAKSGHAGVGGARIPAGLGGPPEYASVYWEAEDPPGHLPHSHHFASLSKSVPPYNIAPPIVRSPALPGSGKAPPTVALGVGFMGQPVHPQPSFGVLPFIHLIDFSSLTAAIYVHRLPVVVLFLRNRALGHSEDVPDSLDSTIRVHRVLPSVEWRKLSSLLWGARLFSKSSGTIRTASSLCRSLASPS